MSHVFYMPTRIFEGDHCLLEHSAALASLGRRALIVTGRASSRKNGSLAEVTSALEKEGRDWALFDRVEPNPGIENCREGALVAREAEADFIIGIGGGSPLDAAKAIAILAVNDLDDMSLFSPAFPRAPLPIACVPTTSGTGSEVTQYAILTNPARETKTSIASESIFPRIAFLDSRFTDALPTNVTVNTALDALSHLVEGSLTHRATTFSSAIAREGLALSGSCLRRLAAGGAVPAVSARDRELRSDLMRASTLGGMVIAHSGTTAVHAMGYSLTYFRGIDHGRANALLLTGALRRIGEEHGERVGGMLASLGYADLNGLASLIDSLLGAREQLSDEEIERFTAIALGSKNLKNTITLFDGKDIGDIYRESTSR